MQRTLNGTRTRYGTGYWGMQAKADDGKKREDHPKKGQIDDPNKKITVLFYRTEAGGEPVRDWLKSLSTEEKRLIGVDIKTVEYGWPIGMPACRPIGKGMFEVRTNLPTRIARVIFYVDKKQRMILLHGFIKKTPKTDENDLERARSNKSKHEKGTK